MKPQPSQRASQIGLWVVGILLLAALACNVQEAAPPNFCNEFDPNVVPPERPIDILLYRDTIEDFLNNDASPEIVESTLRGWGIISEDWGRFVSDQDVNGDRRLDVVISFFYPGDLRALPQPPGGLYVYTCDEEGDWSLLHAQSTAPDDTTSLPQLIAVHDVTGDNLPELAYFTETCYLAACFGRPYIFTWNEELGDFESLFHPERFPSIFRYSEDGQRIVGLPIDEIRFVQTPGNDAFEFKITERQITNRDAGPHRPATYTWYFNGVEFTNPTVAPEPAFFTINALRDADQLLSSGSTARARAEYERILNSGTLSPWGGVAHSQENVEYERRMLDAYTRYRLVLAYAAERDGRAIEVRDHLITYYRFNSGDAPSYFAVLAQTFLDNFYGADSNVDPLHFACQAVRNEVSTSRYLSETLEYFSDTTYFGTHTEPYTVEDLCPF